MNKKNILIIDDDKNDVALFRAWLMKPLADYDFQILAAHCIDQALETVKSHDIDCILLDYRMPMGSGIDFLASLPDAYSDVPVILLTAFPDDILELDSIEAGAQDFLNKADVNAQLLQQRVVAMLEMHDEHMLASYHRVQKMIASIKHQAEREKADA